MKSAKAMIPIPAADLLRFTESATNPVLESQWAPKIAVATAKVDAMALRESSLRGGPQVLKVSLGMVATSVGKERGGLPNEDGVHIVHAIRRGLQIGLFRSEIYQKQVDLERLLSSRRRNELTDSGQTEAQLKEQTAAAIVISVAASYAFQKLSRYKTDAVGEVPMELPGAIEVSLMNPPEAVQCFTFYLAKALQAESVKTGAAAVKMALVYLDKVIAEITLKVAANAFKFTEPFTEEGYKLEDEDFSIVGFEFDRGGAQVSASFNPVKFEQIKGNRDAKHNALRSIHRLVCYDFKVRRNPFLDAFGEFPFITLGKGRPGTGKTLLARAKVTELDRLCGVLGIPYIFWPLPEDIVSEFQGKSAKNMLTWTRAFADTTRLKYGLVDDAENVFKSREGTSTSESQDAINGVMLRFTEGAQAPRDGGWLLDVLTNLPEKLDPAVLSRIPYRVDINGAESIEDFLDQDEDWLETIAAQEKKAGLKVDNSFLDMVNPANYVFNSTQRHFSDLSKVYGDKDAEPKGEVLKRIVTAIRKDHKTNEKMFYAKLFYELHKEFPLYFTSREVRNIQSLVNNRRADFDFPDTWLERPEAFVALPYEEKIKMLLCRQNETLKGLKLSTVRLQETMQYLIVSLSIPENARRRELEQRRDAMILDFRAREEATAFLERTGAKRVAAA